MSIVVSDLWVYTGMPSLVVHLNDTPMTASELTAYIEGLVEKASLADEARDFADGIMQGDTLQGRRNQDEAKDWLTRFDALTPEQPSKGE